MTPPREVPTPAKTRTPAWAIELGLDWPCTPEDLEQRGRELALKYHPDRPGGDNAQFILKRECVEQGRAWFAEGGAK